MDDNKQTVIIDVSLNSNEAAAKANVLAKSITDLKNQQAELKKSGDTVSATYVANALQLKNLQAEQKAYVALSQVEASSMDGLKARLSILTQQWNKLSETEREYSDAGKKLTAEIKSINDKLKEQHETIGKIDFKTAFDTATKVTSVFGGTMSQSASIIKTSYNTLQNTITTFTGVLDKLTAAQEANKTAAILAAVAQETQTVATDLSTAAAVAKTTAEHAETKAQEAYNIALAAGVTEEEAMIAAKAEQAAAIEAKTAAVIAEKEAQLASETATKAQTVATEAQTVATTLGSQAMNLFKLALASTGIGLLIIAIGSLVAYFQQTNEGSKKMKVIMAELGAVMQNLYKVLGPIGKAIFDVFTEPQGAVKLMTNLFMLSIIPLKTLISVLWDLYNGEFKQAFKDIGDGAVEFAQRTVEAKDAAVQMYKDTKKAAGEAADAIRDVDFTKTIKTAKDAQIARQGLNKEERLWSEEKKKQQGEVDLLTKKLRDQNLTEDQRIALAEKAKTIRQSIYDNDLKFAKKNEELVEKEQSLNSKKDFQAITDAKNRVQEVINQKDLEVQGIINRESKLSQADKKKEEATKHHEEAITQIQAKAQKARDEISDLSSRIRIDSIVNDRDRELAIISANYDKQIAEAKRSAYTEFQIQNEKSETLRAQMIKANEYITKLATKLESDKQSKIRKQNEKYAQEDAKTAQEQRSAEFEQQIKEAGNNYEKVHDLRKKQIASDLEFELKNIQLSEAAKNKIRAQYAAKAADNEISYLEARKKTREEYTKREIESVKRLAEAENDILDQKIQTQKDASDLLAGISRENTEISKAAFFIQKAIAIEEIIIQTQRKIAAIETAWAIRAQEDALIPFAGPFLMAADFAAGQALAAEALAQGIIQVGIVAATAISGFAQGGVFNGYGGGGYVIGPGTGTSDEVNAHLSNGESVINARSTSMYAPILSAINQAGGGRAITPTGQSSFASGGLYLSNISQSVKSDGITANAIAKAVATEIKNLPAPVVGVKEIITGINQVTKLQQNGNF